MNRSMRGFVLACFVVLAAAPAAPAASAVAPLVPVGIPFEVVVSDESPFETRDARANEPFVPGVAQIQAVATGCDRFGCGGETVDLTMTLRR